jgi:hypothetical protein
METLEIELLCPLVVPELTYVHESSPRRVQFPQGWFRSHLSLWICERWLYITWMATSLLASSTESADWLRLVSPPIWRWQGSLRSIARPTGIHVQYGGRSVCWFSGKWVYLSYWCFSWIEVRHVSRWLRSRTNQGNGDVQETTLRECPEQSSLPLVPNTTVARIYINYHIFWYTGYLKPIYHRLCHHPIVSPILRS